MARTKLAIVTKRIAACLLLFVIGCASEAAPTDVPSGAKETNAADLPPSVADDGANEAPVLDWGFEPASADCNGWIVAGADAIRATPARTGSYSCKLCSTGKEAGLGLTKVLGSVPAGRYHLSAWVRGRPQNPAPAEAEARIDVESPDGARSAAAPTVSVTQDWDHLEADIELDHGASKVSLTIGSSKAAADRCLFIDDVVLTHQP